MPWNPNDHPKLPVPKNENDYFEVMCRVVFSAGLNWNVINKKWPGIKSALSEFSVTKVAYGDTAIEELLADARMIRSEGKINAIIKNAKAILFVKKEFGSFKNYLETMKKQGIEDLLKDLKKRFSYLGESTAFMFLYGIGEQTPELDKIMKAHHNK